MTFDVLALGETMIQLSPDSVPLDSAPNLAVRVAGAETNVACWLAAAGRRAAWGGAIGDDPLGERVLAAVSAYRVDVRAVLREPRAPTAVFVKYRNDQGDSDVLYYRSASAAAAIRPRAADDLPHATVVHVSGITLAISASSRRFARRAVRRARAAGSAISFDVNHRPKLWGARRARRAIAQIARRVDVLFVGRDEAEAVWGDADAAALTRRFPRARIVIKDAEVGATSFGIGGPQVFVPTPPVEVVEIVGAGDAFAAGYLDALLSGSPEEDRLLRGHAFAALALGTFGDIPSPERLARIVANFTK